MKTLSIGMIGLVMAFNVTASDSVVQQINITQDAVKVAQEELQQGKLDVLPGADAELKLNRFSDEASKALVKFESAVRVRVLQSLSVLVSQYEKTYNNRALGAARSDILNNLWKQIQVVQVDKSNIYREAYRELYSIMPDMPIDYDYENKDNRTLYSLMKYKQKNSACFDSIASCKTYAEYSYTGTIYMTRSAPKKVNFNNTNDFKELNLLSELGVSTLEKVRSQLLEDCYTSTCYFMTQARYTIWKTMIEASLARDIEIALPGGLTIIITKNISRVGSVRDMMGPLLNGIQTEGLINNLPTDASPERIKILSEINSLVRDGSCRRTSKQKEDLCTKTREGCLQPSEIALFQDRFGKNASCLK
jgi:hypothetical protein